MPRTVNGTGHPGLLVVAPADATVADVCRLCQPRVEKRFGKNASLALKLGVYGALPSTTKSLPDSARFELAQLPLGRAIYVGFIRSIQFYTQYQLPAAKHPLGHPRAPIRRRNDRRGPERRGQPTSGARIRSCAVAALSHKSMVRRY